MSAEDYCPHRKDYHPERCHACDPDWTAGRAIAFAEAEMLASFSTNLSRVRVRKPGEE